MEEAEVPPFQPPQCSGGVPSIFYIRYIRRQVSLERRLGPTGVGRLVSYFSRFTERVPRDIECRQPQLFQQTTSTLSPKKNKLIHTISLHPNFSPITTITHPLNDTIPIIKLSFSSEINFPQFFFSFWRELYSKASAIIKNTQVTKNKTRHSSSLDNKSLLTKNKSFQMKKK